MLEVSIVVPVYNIERYLAECINSLVLQSFQNIEIILINDGSTDSSGKICDDYARSYSNIVVVHQCNQGVSAARNAGIKIAKGKYIMFVDSDDWLSIDMVETLYMTQKKHHTDLCIMGYAEELLDKGKSNLYGVDRDMTFPKEKIGEAFMLLEYKGMSYTPCAKLYKKSIIYEFDLLFSKDKSWCEDAEFNLSYLDHIESLSISCQKKYHVRRMQSLMTLTCRFSRSMLEAELSIYKQRLKLISVWKINSQEYLLFNNKRYARALMYCLSNLYKPDSTTTKKENLKAISIVFRELNERKIFTLIPFNQFNVLALFSYCLGGCFFANFLLSKISCIYHKLRK